MSRQNPVPRSVPNGANYYADLQKTGMADYKATYAMFYASAMVDGRPPTTEKQSEIGAWQALSIMRATGDPAFWNDPEAQAAYNQLALKYGGTSPAVPYGAM